MKNSGKINYDYHLCKAIVVVGITMLCIASVYTPLDFSATGASTDVAWDVTLNFTETDGKYDYVIFGEAPDANDGPPVDSYDSPKPPPPPESPYIRAWFEDGLPTPHNELWADYRTYPNLSKVWDLCISWVPSGDTSPTDITISWDISELTSSEYASLILYDFDNATELVEMTQENSYEFTVSPGKHNFQIHALNNPPDEPNNPNPTNGTTNVFVDADLNWTGGDPDVGDIVTYDVYFGTASSPPLAIHNKSDTPFNPPTMNYETTYYWKIVAWDNHDVSTPGHIWSFTTEPAGSSGNGGNGGGTYPPENLPPVANASASEPYRSFVNTEILFNGTSSYDPDDNGYITLWEWNFGDGTNGSGEITIHIYSEIGIYTVILTVTDDDGATDTDTFEMEIVKANNPPTKPDVQGDVIGSRNTECTYIAVSTDEDNDTIKYIFNWDDGTNTTTDFLPNGTKTTQNHSWNDAGRYTITVQATDNETYSQTAELIVMIDAIDVGDLGYFTDDDGDETYDMFHNNTVGIETAVELQDDGTYLIDNDGDGVWNYNYNTTSGMITQYFGETIAGTGDGLQWSFIAVIGIALTIIAVIIYLYKKGSF